MDAVDWNIVAELRENGRLSNVELADRVGLTPAPCLRRVKRLEDDGVIVGYMALLDPVAIGHAFEVLVNVDLTHKDQQTVVRFEAEAAALEEVIELRRMFGLPDYVLRVGTPDLDSFETFVTARLGAVPGIGRIDSHLTMKVVKSPTHRPPASTRRSR
jgi:DNA-binding Lrp family transcriptional regulator